MTTSVVTNGGNKRLENTNMKDVREERWREGGEREFRAFLLEQSSRNVRLAMALNAVMLLFSFCKAVMSTGLTPSSLLMAALPVCSQGGAAIAMKIRPASQEGCLLSTMLFRVFFGFSMMEGILPITPWVELVAQLRLDKLVEIIIMGLLEPVRLSFLIPCRILLGVAYAGIYVKMGMPYPWLQGSLTHAAGLLVGVLMDRHYPSLFQACKARQQHKSKTAQEEVPCREASASKAVMTEVCGNDASKSKAVLTGVHGHGASAAGKPATNTAAVVEHPLDAALEGQRLPDTAVGSLPSAAAATNTAAGPPQGPRSLTAVLLGSISEQRAPGAAKEYIPYKPSRLQKRRVAVVLPGNISQDALPKDAGSLLTRRVEERVGGKFVANMAVRAGCVVICFDVCNVALEGQQQADMQEVCALTAEAVQVWKQEMREELPDWEGKEPLISFEGVSGLEACEQCSMVAHSTVLLLPSPAPSPSTDQQRQAPHQQHQQEPQQLCGQLPHTPSTIPSDPSSSTIPSDTPSLAESLSTDQQLQQEPHQQKPQQLCGQLSHAPSIPTIDLPGPSSSTDRQHLQNPQQLCGWSHLPNCPTHPKAHSSSFLDCPPSMPTIDVPLVVDVNAPTHLGVVRGWRGPEDNPEELEDKESSLCLLAAVQGRFLPLDILRVEGPRVELSINALPVGLAAATSCTTAVLELWAGGKLSCSLQVLLVPASRALVAVEVEAWNQAMARSAAAAGFVDDLVVWVHFCNSCCSHSCCGIEDACDAKLQQLKELGMGLLFHSMCCGLVGIAGLLLEGLTQPPFNLTFDALTSEAQAYKQYTSSPPSQHAPGQADRDADGQRIATLQALAAAAQHSGNTAVLVRYKAWEAEQTKSTPISNGHAPSHPSSPTLWNSIFVIQPFRRLTHWAYHKVAAASPSVAKGSSSSSCSGDKGARLCTGRAAEAREFRAWVTAQTSCLTRAYLIFALGHLGILFLRSGQSGQLETDAPTLASLITLYLVAALGAHKRPQHLEAFVILAYLGRLTSLLAQGCGLVPIPSSFFTALFRFRTEVILEVFFSSSMELVRIPWLIPLRIALVWGYMSLYRKSGFAHPFLESLAMNGASVLMSVIVELRHRQTFARHKAAAAGSAATAVAAASAASPQDQMAGKTHFAGALNRL